MSTFQTLMEKLNSPENTFFPKNINQAIKDFNLYPSGVFPIKYGGNLSVIITKDQWAMNNYGKELDIIHSVIDELIVIVEQKMIEITKKDSIDHIIIREHKGVSWSDLAVSMIAEFNTDKRYRNFMDKHQVAENYIPVLIFSFEVVVMYLAPTNKYVCNFLVGTSCAISNAGFKLDDDFVLDKNTRIEIRNTLSEYISKNKS